MRRFADLAAALKADKAAAERETWPRERMLAHRQERIDAIVRHAVASSRLYRERFAGLVPDSGHVDLRALPPLDKATMMSRYDELVTDPRLRRDDLLAHVATITRDELYLGRYRVMATSGSSGLKGVFVYDRSDWAAVMSGFLRYTRMTGMTPKLPRHRLVYVGPTGAQHMSRRMGATMDVGLHKITVLAVTRPVPEQVRDVQRARPTMLAGFPSMIALLAQEQLAGRLDVRPQVVSTSSEMLTAEMKAAMREAWGVEPFDMYGITEAGMLGTHCAQHRGIHVNEDLMAVEVVDADGNPVPDGEVGAQMLVTSFDNRTQPTIRVAIGDMVAIDPEPCPCGLPLPLLRAIEGRADDIIHLPGAAGARVPVHPLQFAPVAQASEVREFQVVQEGPLVRVRIALRNGDAPGPVQERLAGLLTGRLSDLGVVDPQVRVEVCEGLERDPARMGKLKLVVADG